MYYLIVLISSAGDRNSDFRLPQTDELPAANGRCDISVGGLTRFGQIDNIRLGRCGLPLLCFYRSTFYLRLMFLDESGDHSLKKIDPQFPMFALAGCIFESNFYSSSAIPLIHSCKRSLFGNSDIVFHTADISRNRSGFERVKDERFRRQFHDSINRLMVDLKFTLIVIALNKERHIERYATPSHPYDYCLECLLERFVMYLDEIDDYGEILAESRSDLFDRELAQSFNRIVQLGTSRISASRFQKRVTGLKFAKKAGNDPGLQIADLAVTPMARHVLGRKVHKDVEILTSKLFRGATGTYAGYGLEILP